MNSSNSFWCRRSSVKAASSSAASGATSILSICSSHASTEEAGAGRTARSPAGSAERVSRRNWKGLRPASAPTASRRPARRNPLPSASREPAPGARKLASMNCPRLSAMRFWFAGMIAVWGMGRPERALEQRHHRIPVGKAADRGRFCKRRDKGDPGPPPLEALGHRGRCRRRAPGQRWRSTFVRLSAASLLVLAGGGAVSRVRCHAAPIVIRNLCGQHNIRASGRPERLGNC